MINQSWASKTYEKFQVLSMLSFMPYSIPSWKKVLQRPKIQMKMAVKSEQLARERVNHTTHKTYPLGDALYEGVKNK